MAKGEPPKPEWFRFFPADFIEDEDVVSMDLQERGAYITLLCRQWKNGSIPSDIPSLARMLKTTTEDTERMWAGIGHCFQPHPEEEGRLVQGRLEAERRDSIGKMVRDRKRPRGIPKNSDGIPAVFQGNDTECCSVSVSVSSSKKEEDEKWAQYKALYPQHRFDEERAYRAWLSRKDGEADAILSGLRLWVKSEQWTEKGGRFANWASKFISEGIYGVNPQSLVAATKPAPYLDPRSITG